MTTSIVILISASLLISGLKSAEGGVPDRSRRNTEVRQMGDSAVSESTCPQFELLRGRDGDDGRDGRDGLPGLPGRDGEKGEHGTDGEKGDRGIDGEKGDRGETGDRGIDGEKGDRGETGDRGIDGEEGDRGETGDRGIDGEKGDRGIDGSPGYGMRGVQGLPGVRGSRGTQGPPGPPGVGTGGTMYTRWGRTTCPSTPGTQLVYSGRAAGSHYSHRGGASNYLCMPNDPEYSSYKPGVFGPSYVYGAEYQTANGGGGLLSSSHDNNVPCAVCYTSLRGTVLMLPAKISCPHSWTREYWGYLVSTATRYGDQYRTRFECLDRYPESVPGSAANTDGALFYHTEATCNGLPCPPYDTQKELTCAVCTK